MFSRIRLHTEVEPNSHLGELLTRVLGAKLVQNSDKRTTDQLCAVITGDIRDSARESIVHTKAGLPFLAVTLAPTSALIGPTFVEKGTACTACAASRIMSNQFDMMPRSDRTWIPSDGIWEAAFVAELSALCGLNGMVQTIDHALDFSAFDNQIDRRRVIRAPRCNGCRPREQATFAAWQL